MGNTFSSRNTLKTKLLAAINAAGSADQIVKLSRSIEKANLDDDADLETALDTKVSTLATLAEPEDLEKLAFGVKKLRTPEGAGTPTSSMIAEGSSNLYVTQDRVRGSFSAAGDLSYDSGTGVLSYTALPDALTVYATVADLPSSGVAAGAKGIVEENKRLYVFTGASWVGVGLVDQKPSFDSNPDGSYALTPGGDTVITLSATDPQGDAITYSHQVTAGALGGSSVAQSDNVFTITGSTNPADTAAFSITFSASDGTNVSATTPSEFTIQFGTDWSSLAYLEDLPSVGATFMGIGLDADDNSVIYTDRDYLNAMGGGAVGQKNSRGINIDVSTSSSSFGTPVNQYHGYPNSSTLDWSDYGSISNPSWYGLDAPAAFNQSPVLTENYVAASNNTIMNASGKAGAMFVYNRNTGGGGLTGDTAAHVGTLHATIENVGGVTGSEYTEDYGGQKGWGTNGMDFVESHPIHGDIAVFSTSVNFNDPNTGGGAVQSYGNSNHSTGNTGYCEVVKLSDTSKANRVGIFNNELGHAGNQVMFGNQNRNGVCISPTTDHVAIAHPEALGGADYLSESYGQTNMAYAHIGGALNNYNNPSNGEYIKKEGRIGIYSLSTGALVRTISPESVPMSSRYLGTYSNDNNTYNKVMGSEFGYKGIKADSTGFVACGKQPSAPWASTYASGWYRGYPTWDVIFEKYSWSTGQLLWKCEVEVGNWTMDDSLDTETGMFDMFNGYIAMWVYCKSGESQTNTTTTTRTSQIVIINSTTGTIEKTLDVGNYQFGAWNIALNSNSVFISSYQGGIDRYSI